MHYVIMHRICYIIANVFIYLLVLVWLVGWLYILIEFLCVCSCDCLGTHSVDQAGIKLRHMLASASQVLGLETCTTTAQLIITNLL